MEFAVLGRLRVTSGDVVIEVPGARLRALLALLILRANHTVPGDQLADAVWDGRPSPANREALPTYVMRLRRALGPEAGGRIVTRPGGYSVEADDDELDVNRFHDLCDSARRLAADGEWDTAYRQLDAALALWRGEPLADVPIGEALSHDVDELLAARLAAQHHRIEVGLLLGRHAQLLPGIATLVRGNPLDEQLRARWMLALYRSGRQGEALEVYQEARRILAEELGVDPSPPLQELYRQILNGDPGLAAPEVGPAVTAAGSAAGVAASAADRIVPRQLPAAVRHFTGRSLELSALDGLTGTAEAQATGARASIGIGSGAVAIAAITGTAGVGKTALAVYFAHHVADRFPDGQLYANLRGFEPSGEPADPEAVVRAFLDGLGVPASAIPADPGAQFALYRSRLAGTRTLIVLDNARDAAQIRALLPASAGCLVVVTSRRQLPGLVALDGAVPVCLGTLTVEESVTLLEQRLGRPAAGDPAARELAELCAGLPLALNIVAARAAAGPDVPLGVLVAELREAGSRLDVLSAGEAVSDTRAVFSWSYQVLGFGAARLFRLLGLNPAPDISLGAVTALAGRSGADAIGSLIEAGLLERSEPGRFRVHDLLRLYAAELVAGDPQHETTAAIARLGNWYLHSAYSATKALAAGDAPLELPDLGWVEPQTFHAYGEALDWYDRERENLVAAVQFAAEHGFHEIAWKLGVVQRTYFLLRFHLGPWIQTFETALASAVALGDQSAEARVANGLGAGYRNLGDLANAERYQLRTVALRREVGDRRGEGAALLNLATIKNDQGDHAGAIDVLAEALMILEECGDTLNQGLALIALGVAHIRSGRSGEAVDSYLRALPLVQEAGHRYAGAVILGNLGDAYRDQGGHEEALDVYRRAAVLRRELGDERLEAASHRDIGDSLSVLGRLAEARRAWEVALALYERLGHPDAVDVRRRLGS